MEDSAREYLEHTSNAESSTLKEYWGDPVSFVKNFMDTLEPQERGIATRTKKKILIFSILSLAVILLLAIYLLFYHASSNITLVYWDVY
ncbi:MAG: hypothetical protein HFE39_00590 [Clostridiales bacterium]|nr:hypothetical protein [Clostridiales bacterium]